MAQLFVAQAHQRVFDLVRERLLWMSQGADSEKGVAAVDLYDELSRVNAFNVRRQVAAPRDRARRIQPLVVEGRDSWPR